MFIELFNKRTELKKDKLYITEKEIANIVGISGFLAEGYINEYAKSLKKVIGVRCNFIDDNCISNTKHYYLIGAINRMPENKNYELSYCVEWVDFELDDVKEIPIDLTDQTPGKLISEDGEQLS